MSGTTQANYNATKTYRPSGILYDPTNKWLYFTDGEPAVPSSGNRRSSGSLFLR